MRGRVFLSCGQQPPERDVANSVRDALRHRGFDVYVAINVQTMLEINTGIIAELKNCDFYLFVNFCRERIDDGHRGSLFSNQELAIAYALGFDRLLIVNQVGIRLEGMLAYIGVNTETFETFDVCPAVVGRAIERAGWSPTYTRRLRAERLRFGDGAIVYGRFAGLFLYVDILNGRPDVAALEATARLAEFGEAGNPLRPTTIRSPLKATGRPGFSHTIFPKSYEAFDLLCVGGLWEPTGPTAQSGFPPLTERGVYLNSALDVAGAGRLPMTDGIWWLRFEVYAIGFPLLSVLLELDITTWARPDAHLLSQEMR